MKKALSLLLALCMVISLCTTMAAIPVFAQGDLTASEVFDEVGVYAAAINKTFDGDETIDIDLGSATDISGVRIYSRTDVTTSPAGSPKKWELYVSFDNGSSYAYVDADSAFGTSGTGYLGLSAYESQAWSDESQSHHKVYLPSLTTRLGYTIAAVTNVRIVVKAAYSDALIIPSIAVLKSWQNAEIDSNMTLHSLSNGAATTYQQTWSSFGASDVADGRLVTDEMTDIAPVRAYYIGRGTGESYAYGTAKQLMDGDLGSVAYTNGLVTIDLGEWVYVSGIRYYPPKNTAAGAGNMRTYVPAPGYYNFDENKLTKSINTAAWAATDKVAPFPSYTDGEEITTTLYDAPITFNFETGGTPVDAARKVRYISINNWVNISQSAASPYGLIGEIRLIRPKMDAPRDEADLPSYPTLSGEAYSSFSSSGGDYSTNTGGIQGLNHALDGSVPDAPTTALVSALNPSQSNVGHLERDFLYFSANPNAYFDLKMDFGEGNQATFSGVRLYNRLQQTGQVPTKVSLGVSDDGTNYLWSDTLTLPFVNQTNLQLVAAAVTVGGEEANLTGRYVKLRVTDTLGHNHIAFSEAALLAPDGGHETYTYDAYLELAGSRAEEIIALIDEIGEVSALSADTIRAARVAYDAAPAMVQALVTNYAALTAAEEAYAAFCVTINVQNGSQILYGLRTVDFTVPSTSTIKSVSYNDVIADEDDWSVIDNGDGTYTVTLAGEYASPTLTTWVTQKKYYYVNSNATFGWAAGALIQPSDYQGRYVTEILYTGLGDHFLTFTNEEDEEILVNLISEAGWTGVSVGAGAVSADELTPKASWKVRTNQQNNASYAGGLFDKNTSSFIQSTYLAAAYAETSGGAKTGDQVMMYTVMPIDIDVDLAEETTFSGVRFYKRNQNTAPTQVTLFGSNDDEAWEDLGTYNMTATASVTESLLKDAEGMINNASYRYLRIRIDKINNASSGVTFCPTEFGILKERIGAAEDSFTLDIGENADLAIKVNTTTAPETVTVDDVVQNDWSFEGNVLTLSKTLFASEGSYAVSADFGALGTMDITVTVTDTSLVTYRLEAASNSGQGDNELRLFVGTEKEVASITYNGTPTVAVGDDPAFTQGGDGYVTILRPIIRRLYQWYELIDASGEGEATIRANFTDETYKDFHVTFTADWVTVANNAVASAFEEDEITEGIAAWKVRVDSSTNAHFTPMFYAAIPTGNGQQRWHTNYTATPTFLDDISGDMYHYIDIDLGAGNETVYSGARYIARWDNSGGAWLGAQVFGSDDFEEWTELFPETTYPGEASNVNAPGTRTTVRDFDFGKNVTYRYLRIKVKPNTNGRACANGIRLLKERDFSEQEAAIANVIGLIDAIGTVSAASGDAIDAARSAYDALGAAAQRQVTNYAALTAAEALYASFVQTVNVTDGTQVRTGTRVLTFTLNRSDVAEVSYAGKALSEDDYAVTDNGDDTFTLTIGGTYPELYYFTEFRTGSVADDAVFAADNATYGWSAGDTILGHFSGWAAYRILADGLGDHFITVAFDDETETVFNVVTTSNWITVGGSAYTAALAADELAPAATWRMTTNSPNNNNIITRAFDGVHDGTSGAYWESDFLAANYTSEKADKTNTTQVLSYQPLPVNLYHDFGEATTISGFRFYRRNNTLPKNLDVFTSNDGETWTFYKNMGDLASTATQTYQFLDNITTRYLYIRINQLASGETLGGNVSIAEIAFLAEQDFSEQLEAVANAEKLIGALDDLGVITAQTAEANSAITAAREAYDALGAWQERVSNVNTLLVAEAAYASLNQTIDCTSQADSKDGARTLTFTLQVLPTGVSYGGEAIDAADYTVTANDDGSYTLTIGGAFPAGAFGKYFGGAESIFFEDNATYGWTAGENIMSFFKGYKVHDILAKDGLGDHLFTITYDGGSITANVVTTSSNVTVTTAAYITARAEDEVAPASAGAWKIMTDGAKRYTNMTNMFDGNTGTHYETPYIEGKYDNNGTGTNQVLLYMPLPVNFYVDLGEATEMSGIRFYRRSGFSCAGEIDIFTSEDGETWTHYNNFSDLSGESIINVSFGETIETRYLRIRVNTLTTGSSIGANVNIAELAFLAPQSGEVTVDVSGSTAGGSVKINDVTSQSGEVEPGTEVTLTAEANAGATFKYWLDLNTGKVLGTDQDLVLAFNSDRQLRAVFDEGAVDSYFVTFFGREQGSVVATVNVNMDETAAEFAPSEVKMYSSGYTFTGWNKALDVAYNIATDFIPVYEKQATTYAVTVTGGAITSVSEGTTGDGAYKYNTRVTVAAGAPDPGMVFAGWQNASDEIVSYDAAYTFYVGGAVSLTATYAASVIKTPSLVIEKLLTTSGTSNIAGFLTTRVIPEGFTLVEAGIIYVKDAADTTELVLSNVGGTSTVAGKTIKVGVASNMEVDQYKLSASYGVNGIRARGYLIYKNTSTGEVTTIYTEVQTVE